MPDWVPDTPLYDELVERHKGNAPLPAPHTHDDHDHDPIDPGEFPSFDHVDSRTIADPGAPA